MKKYSVLDISCFIINEHNRLYPNRRITNLRLQKLLYFTQAIFILNNRECCFKEPLVAWPYGPVNIDAYEEFKKYGKASIEPQTHYRIFIPFDENIIDKEDKDIIIDLLEWAKDKSDADLVELTHKQSPWINAIENGINTVISLNSIRDFFIRSNQ